MAFSNSSLVGTHWPGHFLCDVTCRRHLTKPRCVCLSPCTPSAGTGEPAPCAPAPTALCATQPPLPVDRGNRPPTWAFYCSVSLTRITADLTVTHFSSVPAAWPLPHPLVPAESQSGVTVLRSHLPAHGTRPHPGLRGLARVPSLVTRAPHPQSLALQPGSLSCRISEIMQITAISLRASADFRSKSGKKIQKQGCHKNPVLGEKTMNFPTVLTHSCRRYFCI